MRRKRKTKVFGIVLVVVMILLSLLFLFPVVWMIANSFKPDNAITADMNSFQAFLPPTPGNGFFDNYVSVITNTDFLKYMGNTLLYAAVLIVLGIIVNGLAGYALAKIKFPFSDKWLLIIMMSACRTIYTKRHSLTDAVPSNISSQWYFRCPKPLWQQSAFSRS